MEAVNEELTEESWANSNDYVSLMYLRTYLSWLILGTEIGDSNRIRTS